MRPWLREGDGWVFVSKELDLLRIVVEYSSCPRVSLYCTARPQRRNRAIRLCEYRKARTEAKFTP